MKNLSFFEILRDLIRDYFKEHLKDYLHFALKKLEGKVIDKVSSIAATLLGLIFLLFTFALFFIFSTIALALFLGEVLGNSYWGFLIISIFYLSVGIMLWIFRNALIKRPITRMLNKAMKGDSSG